MTLKNINEIEVGVGISQISPNLCSRHNPAGPDFQGLLNLKLKLALVTAIFTFELTLDFKLKLKIILFFKVQLSF